MMDERRKIWHVLTGVYFYMLALCALMQLLDKKNIISNGLVSAELTPQYY